MNKNCNINVCKAEKHIHQLYSILNECTTGFDYEMFSDINSNRGYQDAEEFSMSKSLKGSINSNRSNSSSKIRPSGDESTVLLEFVKK